MASQQQIEKIVDDRVNAIVDKKIADAKIDIIAVEKRAWLDNQCKQYENNIKVLDLMIVGLSKNEQVFEPAGREIQDPFLR